MGTSGPDGNNGVVPPFAALLGIQAGQSSEGFGSVTMEVRNDHLQESGVVQGGLITTLIDYAFYQAVKSRLKPDQRSVTIECKGDFIAPAKEGELTATARIVSGGRRILVVEGEVTDNQEVLIARGLSTYMVLEPRV